MGDGVAASIYRLRIEQVVTGNGFDVIFFVEITRFAYHHRLCAGQAE
ncbi:hypothetical protein [Candidatus Pollutiaquabacter sp.]|nr:hypothetical protein [Bacteroidota bacterium]